MTEPIPHRPFNIDEASRTAALHSYQVMDSGTEQLFEDIVELAQAIGGTKIAFLSLVDSDRQWFKAARGLDITETPRSIAFCDHAIRTDQVMVVLDASKDPRFADNPLVTGPAHLRFYAGAPIITPDGYAIGTVCLSDTEPHDRFGHADALAALARQAAALLELRRSVIQGQLAAELVADQRDRLWDNSLDMMVIVEPNGDFLVGNPAWTDMFGPPPVDRRMNIADYFDVQETVPLIVMAKRQKDVQIDRKMRNRNGQLVEINWSLAREDDLVFGIGRDVTKARETEARLAQSQRLESIGQLTGGIAHDFNNLLTIILGNLEIAQRRIGGTETAKASTAIAHAKEGAERAASLTQRLLAFARKQSLRPVLVAMPGLLGELAPLLRQALDERFAIALECPPDIWPVRIDSVQLENAVLNLVVNARDAMADNGTVTITVANAEVGDQVARRYDARPGSYVALSVADTGPGIAEDVAARIFEPFFTTKEIGKGTGLGLSQVQGFVAQSGGFITLDTAPDAGTRFTLWLPAEPGATVDGPTAPDQPPLASGLSGRSILLVEDNIDLRRHVAELLREEAMLVTEAENGAMALAVLRHGAHLPDLVLSDVTMPQIDGVALAQAIANQWPALPVILMTGYAREDVAAKGTHDALLHKPFSPDDLLAAVKGCLEKSFALGNASKRV